MESNLWKSSAAAVWAVYDQWMAGSLLQHVRADLEPARIRNGVSLFCAHFSSCKRPSASLAHVRPLLMCVSSGSLSHRAGWAGLGRSPPRPQLPRAQSCPTWATTIWRVIKHSEPSVKPRGFFFSFFLILVNCFGTKRQRPYSQSLCNGWLLFKNRFIFTVVGRSLAQNFVIPYTTMLIHSRVK